MSRRDAHVYAVAMSHASTRPAPSLTLADGGRFPSVGLGFWKMPKSQTPALVREAVRVGYRHLDGAGDYGHEPPIGTGV